MFFDRLLKLQSLKFRLLGGTSFAQLYSAERLPLHKFRKDGAMLSPLIAGLLAACGGGGGGVVPLTTIIREDDEGDGAGPQEGPATPSFDFFVYDGVDLNRIQVFDKDGVQVEYDFGDFRSEANSFTATGDLPVTFYGGGGNDTLKGAGGPAHLYGGKGHDTLIGSSNDDVLYGDKGRDVLTGGDGKDVFVAQPIDAAAVKSAVGARGREGSPLSKFYDLVEDFELGKDKIGIFDFKAVQDLAKENDNNIERARQLYWEQLEQRAKVDLKSQLDIMLEDLGYYFKPLRLTKFPGRDDDSGTIHWVLVDENNAKKRGDDTALLMFHGDGFASATIRPIRFSRPMRMTR